MAMDSRGARLLADLSGIFRKDPDIDEYDFIPVAEPKQNKKPFILEHHKLGFEHWCVKVLYQYAYKTLLAWKQKKAGAKHLEYGSLLDMTRAVLLINAECLMAWNIRKELIEASYLKIVDDLRFGALVLTKHPKSAEVFSHRKWLLSRFVESNLASSNGSTCSTSSLYEEFVNMDAIDVSLVVNNNFPADNNGDLGAPEFHEVLRREIGVCSMAAEKYSCNYYAWTHRIWVMQYCYNCTLQILFVELHATEKWVKSHVSDHSGFHYRQFLLTNIYNQTNQQQFKDLIHKELLLIKNLIKMYQGHEAMWYHRRYVCHMICNIAQEETTSIEAQETQLLETSNLHQTTSQKKTKLENSQKVFLEEEIESVSKTELNDRNTYNRTLAQHFVDWMQRALRNK